VCAVCFFKATGTIRTWGGSSNCDRKIGNEKKGAQERGFEKKIWKDGQVKKDKKYWGGGG